MRYKKGKKNRTAQSMKIKHHVTKDNMEQMLQSCVFFCEGIPFVVYLFRHSDFLFRTRLRC